MRLRRLLPAFGMLLLAGDHSFAQDLDVLLRNDRAGFQGSRTWIYDSLADGIRIARQTQKPLLVVFRCIPCKACQKFDDEVARRDKTIADLLDEFVCVRVPEANNMDLAHFQFDYDLSFAVFFTDADLLIYGRYGTRSERPEAQDISLGGLRKAMAEALRMHRNRAEFAASLSGKQAKPARFKTPREYPGILAGFQTVSGDAEITAKSCIHCHQVRNAERRLYHSAGEPLPENVIYPYPDPSVVGLELDAKEMAKVDRVAPGSPAERAGIKPGDEIVALDDQPILSIADVQWVLHNTPAATTLGMRVRRSQEIVPLSLSLESGWRRGNISWRTTSWPLREMALGGMKLEALDNEQKRQAGIAPGAWRSRSFTSSSMAIGSPPSAPD